ncbi:hypothetical protein PGTUg99_016350 [Puccinia graminis f. sp. tritici]|uniref:Uncharacterized protein n=1 Tax=Puccinia graminis f. sp. tritici TaxID=56615 RepID=A0A5B0RZS7_PUCGR|nr:hypothetical protein PGTUg99_016350 [Puccinia graminis f. sp. tritici]
MFKKLRLIWSSSPSATAEIFQDLKLTHPEPDAETASLVGMDDISKGEKGKLDLMAINKTQQNQNFGICSSAHKVLKALPGMDELKARKLIYGVVNTPATNNNNNTLASEGFLPTRAPARRKESLPTSWFVYHLAGRNPSRRAGLCTSSLGGTPTPRAGTQTSLSGEVPPGEVVHRPARREGFLLAAWAL